LLYAIYQAHADVSACVAMGRVGSPATAGPSACTLFEGNLPLLLAKKYTPPGETPRIEHRRPRCKTLNVFTYDPSKVIETRCNKRRCTNV
jgi:hypothetical protein